MKRIFSVSLLLLSTLSAHAQGVTPSQMALQIDGAVNSMATTLESLQTQLKMAQDRIKELEAEKNKPAVVPIPAPPAASGAPQ